MNIKIDQIRNQVNDRILMKRLFIGIISMIPFIGGVIVNLWFNDAAYNYNLNKVPTMQQDKFLGSDPITVIMNIFSNLFNPILCAGYILVLYLLSHRKFKIIVFLLWFIFLSVFLSFLKMLIQQPRPFWIQGANIQMREFICYTEYGSPSGHSMLGFILIQFVIRFIQRRSNPTKKQIYCFYIIGIIIHALVIFSRIILGMHSINQVLFGLLLGCNSIFLYYTYIEKYIVRLCMQVCKKQLRNISIVLLACLMLFYCSVALLGTLVPQYDNQQYIKVLGNIDKCKGISNYSSFQYRCLKDSALIMGMFGIIYGLITTKNPQYLMKTLNYSRKTKQFVIRTVITLLLPVIPIILFMNPFWSKIELQDQFMGIFIWGLNCLGLFFGTFILVGVVPKITHKLGLQIYQIRRESSTRELNDNSLILRDIQFFDSNKLRAQ